MPATTILPVLPFIVGAGRSGTTLLRAMLDAHPDMAVLHEPRFVPAMGGRRRRYEQGATLATQRFLTDLFADHKFRRIGLAQPDVRAALQAQPVPSSYVDAVRRVFALYARLQGKSRYGDKTPSYVFHLPMLAELFPEARFIHLVRDGRDVALAFSDVFFGPGGVGEAAHYWRRRLRAGQRAGGVLGPGRYRVVRYEDLVEHPEGVLRGLCEFIDLPFDPLMLRYYERPAPLLLPAQNPEDHQRLLLPPTKKLRDWRTEMAGEDLLVFEAVAGDVLAEFGYERAVARPSARARTTARWRWLRWRAWRARTAARRLRRCSRG